jgi:hypothetical protein
MNQLQHKSGQINSNVWLKTPQEMLQSLLQDEAKNAAILDEVAQTIKQLRAKSSFRLALINSLLEHMAAQHNQQMKGNNK